MEASNEVVARVVSSRFFKKYYDDDLLRVLLETCCGIQRGDRFSQQVVEKKLLAFLNKKRVKNG